jgi:Retroviral aspartyl protease
VLGIGELLSGRNLTALLDSGCEEGFIISRRLARKHGIAAAETARSRGGVAFPDGRILVATNTESLELDAGGVKSTCNALVFDITAHNCILGRLWPNKHNPHINWHKNRLMIAKNRMK